jgi:cytokinin dehydrogenase
VTQPAGFRPGTGEWVSTIGPGVVAVPPLAGVLSTASADLAAAARDFGNHVHHRPVAVLRPRSAVDIAAISWFGRSCGLAVVPRGTGHSVDGQAQADGGIVVDMTTLADVGEVAPDRVSVAAGARWSTVLDATLPNGLAPPVLPDYLELSVGGTLAAGGLGGASHRHGCQADNVHELVVVTPDGVLVGCSPSRNADLFDAVRGGQGQHGIITRATLTLVPARSSARRYQLPYRELGPFLADQRRLIQSGRFEHVDGRARPDGRSGWTYLLDAVIAFDPPHEPADRPLLNDLRHDRGAETIDTGSYRDFLHRAAPVEARLRATGSWQHHPHPRITLLLPGRHAESIIGDALQGLPPDDIEGGVLIYPVPTARIASPHVPKARDAVSVMFSVPRTAPPDEPATLDRMRLANHALRTTAERLGGVSYGSPPAPRPLRAAG